MSTQLATYLHDHLAGSKLAIDLLGMLRDAHAGEPLARVAAELLTEVEEDRRVLEHLVDRAGNPPAALVKEGMAWLGGQSTRAKLRQAGEGIGTLETLETLALGILGKAGLWRALAQMSATDPRIRDIDLPGLIERAQRQHARVEEYRLDQARRLFSTPAP